MNWWQIDDAAQAELDLEDNRAAIDQAKVRIKARKNAAWWHKLIPFTVTIRKR